MREPHLDLLALAARLLEALGASKRPGNVSGMLMDVPVLIYGGVGLTQAEFEVGIKTTFVRESMSGVLDGYVLRGGIEATISSNLTIGGAYQFSSFGGHIEREPLNVDIHKFMLTANYNFSPRW